MTIPFDPSVIKTTDELLQAPTTIYADQLAQLSMGPFISKLTFGMDRKQGEIPTPLQTVVMPTPALLSLAKQVLEVANAEKVLVSMRAELTAYLTALTAVAPPK